MDKDTKKKLARLEMLKKFSKSKASEMHEPTVGENLKKKKLSKVTVMAEDEKGLTKGLSKAQQILKAKLGEKLLGKDEEESEEEYEDCAECEGVGCEVCEDEEEADEE